MWHSFLNNQRTFQTTFLRNVWLQTAGITEFGASSSNATGNASSSSHTSDATYATYASMDQPAEQRLASWWSLKTSNCFKRCSPRITKDCGSLKKSRRQGTASAIAAVAIQPSTRCGGTSWPLCFGRKQQHFNTFQYILIQFPGFVLSHSGKKKVIKWGSINFFHHQLNMCSIHKLASFLYSILFIRLH